MAGLSNSCLKPFKTDWQIDHYNNPTNQNEDGLSLHVVEKGKVCFHLGIKHEFSFITANFISARTFPVFRSLKFAIMKCKLLQQDA